MTKEVGKIIRQERRKRDLTLKQLSNMTGISQAHLSQIERGQARPSIKALKKITRQFGISAMKLLAEELDNNNNELDSYRFRVANELLINYTKNVRVVRGNNRKQIKLPGCGIYYDLLTPDLNRQLQVLYMCTSKGEKLEEPIVDPPGEKFGYVLNGTLEVTVKDEVYRLEPGDTISLPADWPAWWRAIEGDKVEVIWVATPPNF